MGLLFAVDTGWSGAVAIKDKDNVVVHYCPQNIDGLLKIFSDYNLDGAKVLIERVHASPIFGAVGNFRLGENWRMWQDFLMLLDISYEVITPSVWQKKIISKESGRDTKVKSWNFAVRMYPHINELGRKAPTSKKDKVANIADALCILTYFERFIIKNGE